LKEKRLTNCSELGFGDRTGGLLSLRSENGTKQKHFVIVFYRNILLLPIICRETNSRKLARKYTVVTDNFYKEPFKNTK